MSLDLDDGSRVADRTTEGSGSRTCSSPSWVHRTDGPRGAADHQPRTGPLSGEGSLHYRFVLHHLT